MNKFLKCIAILIIVSAVQKTAGQSITTRGRDTTSLKLDSVINKRMEASGLVGLGAAIIVDNKVVWSKGYGYADKENKKPFTPNTIMNIASISKTVTGVCLMKAVEEKKLSLDDDINKYLPFKVVNPNFPNKKITLRNLATHTSGITEREPIYDSTYYYGGDSPVPLGRFLKDYFDPTGKYYSKDNFLNKEPGSYREYSNIAAGLAGYIIEQVTGKKLNEYSKQYIFTPLKMKNTGWFLSEINRSNHSKLYSKQGDTLKIIPLYGGTTYPDGGVRTSVSELSHFFIALLNNGVYNGASILKKQSVTEMLRFQYTTANKPENVQLDKINSGIFWATKLGATRIGHNGSDPGVRTFMLADLPKEVGVILFVNTSLTDKDEGKFFAIYEELYKYGVQLKDATIKR